VVEFLLGELLRSLRRNFLHLKFVEGGGFFLELVDRQVLFLNVLNEVLIDGFFSLTVVVVVIGDSGLDFVILLGVGLERSGTLDESSVVHSQVTITLPNGDNFLVRVVRVVSVLVIVVCLDDEGSVLCVVTGWMSSSQSVVVGELLSELTGFEGSQVSKDDLVTLLLLIDLVLVVSVEIVHLGPVLIDNVLALMFLALFQSVKMSSLLDSALLLPVLLVLRKVFVSCYQLVTSSVESLLLGGFILDLLVLKVVRARSEQNWGLVGKLAIFPFVFKLLYFHELLECLVVQLLLLGASTIPLSVTVVQSVSHMVLKLSDRVFLISLEFIPGMFKLISLQLLEF